MERCCSYYLSTYLLMSVRRPTGVQGDISSDLLSDMDVNKIDNLLWL